jgi:hypothetical protein
MVYLYPDTLPWDHNRMMAAFSNLVDFRFYPLAAARE